MMIPPLPPLPLRAQSLSGPLAVSGTGTVEKEIEPGTFLVSVGKDRITVRLQDGSLTIGEHVRLSGRRDAVLIQPIPVMDTVSAGGGAYRYSRLSGSAQADPASILELLNKLAAAAGQGPLSREYIGLFAMAEADFERIDPKLTKEIVRLIAEIGSAEIGTAGVADRRALQEALVQLAARLPAGPGMQPPAADRTIMLRQSLPEMLYRFTNLEDVFMFFESNGMPAKSFENGITAILKRDGAAIIRTTPFGATETAVSLLNQDDSGRETAGLAGRFTSRAFGGIGPGVLEQVLRDTGRLDLDALRSLDSRAAALQLPGLSARAGSGDAQAAALAQWMNIASDRDGEFSAMASVMPVFSLPSILDSYEEFAAAYAAAGRTRELPLLEQFAISGDSPELTNNKKELVASVITRLGYNTERILFSENPVPPSLKAFLLEAYSLESSMPEGPQQPAGSGGKPAILPEIVQTLRAAERLLVETRASLVSSVKAIVTDIVGVMDDVVTVRGSEQKGSLPETSKGWAAVSKPQAGLRQAFLSTMTELASSIETAFSREENALNRAIAAASILPEKAAGVPGASVTGLSLNDPLRVFAEIARRMESLIESLSRDIEAFTGKNGEDAPGTLVARALENQKVLLNRIDALIEAGFRNIMEKLDSLRTQFSRQLELPAAPDDDTRKPSQGLQQSVPGAAVPVSPELAARASLSEIGPNLPVKQMVESVINRFESLQLLARQTVSGGGGEQQIVSVPMKIGGEWTELQLRFVKQKRTPVGSGRGRSYTVFMNVAPSLLGAISVKMDYDTGKRFNLAMSFESSETRDWFLDRSAEIRQALVQEGIESPHIQFIMERKKQPSITASSSTTDGGNATIDLTA